jgi:hypothetical protein
MTRPRAAALALASAAVALAAAAAGALETDQFAAWRRPLADSTAVVNARINLEIRRSLADLEPHGGSATCDDVVLAVRHRLEFEIFQPLELWALQSPLVDRYPARGDQEERFLHDSIYRRSRAYDIAFWMPLSPTIEVGGVRIGTDKLAHFASSGWRYRNAYLRRLRRGETPEQAELGAVRWGILEERSINGTLSTGIFSRSDLEANHAGMLFYLGLCDGPDPVVERAGGGWRVRRPYDLAAAVTPEWDESYLAPLYRSGRWRKVRPEIAASCSSLADPAVQARLAAYRQRDRVTMSERFVAELAAAGTLPDPVQFSFATVCPTEVSALPEVPPVGADDGGAGAAAPLDLAAAIVALEQDRVSRTFGLWRAGVSYPLSAAASLGALFTRPPRSFDCRSLCELSGVTLQATAGLTGGELAVGWARAFAETGPSRRFLADVPLAYGVRAALVRTWGDAPLEPPAQTLAGVEAALTITRVSFTLGVLTPIGGGGHRDDLVLSGSVGFGF